MAQELIERQYGSFLDRDAAGVRRPASAPPVVLLFRIPDESEDAEEDERRYRGESSSPRRGFFRVTRAPPSPVVACALCRATHRGSHLISCRACDDSHRVGFCTTCNLVLITLASLRCNFDCPRCQDETFCARHWIQGDARCPCGFRGVPDSMRALFGRFMPRRRPDPRERAARLGQVVSRDRLSQAARVAWPELRESPLAAEPARPSSDRSDGRRTTTKKKRGSFLSHASTPPAEEAVAAD